MADKKVEEEDHVSDAENNLLLVRVVESADGGSTWTTKFAFPRDVVVCANHAISNGENDVTYHYVYQNTFDDTPVQPIDTNGHVTDLAVAVYGNLCHAEVGIRDTVTNAMMYIEVTDIVKRSLVDGAITTSSAENSTSATVLVRQKDSSGWAADPVVTFIPDADPGNARAFFSLTGLAATSLAWSIRLRYTSLA